MPSRNSARDIPEAIRALQRQTLKEIEIIIVDESNDDKTRPILREFARKDPRIIVKEISGLGLSGSLNLAMRTARAPLIARADSDDISAPRRLELQAKFMREHPKVGLLGGWARLIDAKGRSHGPIRMPTSDAEIRKVFLRRNVFWPNICFRKSLLKKSGVFDTTINNSEDYELFSRMMEHCEVAILPVEIIKYRWDFNQNLTFRVAKRTEWNALRVRWRMLRRGMYPWWDIVFLIKPFLSYLVPMRVKRAVITTFGITPYGGRA
jgi:glycosyltransferase involved in cell wall biosynthesis